MDNLSPSSDPSAYGSVYTRSTKISFSDDAVGLATAKPKKRAGRTKFNETRHPVYRGVRMRNLNKWVCEVREPNKKTRIWLGTYPTAEMAARAHDVAALALRGSMACLNFADSVWRLPLPVSKDAKDIRKAANEAAEAFRPKDDNGGSMSDDKGSDVTEDSEETVAAEVKVEVVVEDGGYMDEERVFYMPRLICDMAEGMLMSPPRCFGGWSSDDVESQHDDMSLWNFST